MGVHVEWMTASATNPELVPYGEEMPDGQTVTQPGAIVFSENECLVIEGTMEDLQRFAARTLRSVQPHRHAELQRLTDKAKQLAEPDRIDPEASALWEALDVALTILGREDLR